MIKIKIIIPAFVLVSFTVFTQSLLAQENDSRHPLLTDRFTLGFGGFIQDKSIKLRVDGQFEGPSIDVDERWKLSSDDTSVAGVFRWKFGEKWTLSGQYFNTDDSAQAVLGEDVNWEDVTFKAGSNVGVGVDLSVARLFFGRTFSSGPRHEFGLGAGLHWLEIGAFLEGEVFINDESRGFDRRSVSADFPLPNLGGWYDYAFSPKWMATARIDGLYVDIGDYKGGLWNSSLGVQYQAFRHVGFLLAYQVIRLDVDVDKSGWRGAVELTYKGPFLAVTANW